MIGLKCSSDRNNILQLVLKKQEEAVSRWCLGWFWVLVLKILQRNQSFAVASRQPLARAGHCVSWVNDSVCAKIACSGLLLYARTSSSDFDSAVDLSVWLLKIQIVLIRKDWLPDDTPGNLIYSQTPPIIVKNNLLYKYMSSNKWFTT